jgi:hypothetical protein
MKNLWTPEKEWEGQEAVLIGGGSSLRDFDFSTLKGKNTIGCNNAFRLGSEIIKICLFCDATYFHKVKHDLEKFQGRIVSDSPDLAAFKIPWLLKMSRVRWGLTEDQGKIGFNYSTGAEAINLAIILGATKIYLLGYDLCHNEQGKSHWHDKYPKITPKDSFNRFDRGFEQIYKELCRFPQVQVWNVTDGSSKLPLFDRMTFEEFRKR